jgi:hypothetical protein
VEESNVMEKIYAGGNVVEVINKREGSLIVVKKREDW